MLVIWGSGNGRSVLGELPEDKCHACGEKATRSAFVDFKYWHIWYLFSFLTGRDYRTACNACGAVSPYDKAEAKANFQRDNIPFIRKNGWAICAALLVLFLAFGAVSSRSKRQRIEAMLNAPHIHDVYLADLAKVASSGYAPGSGKMYGVMVLVSEGEDGRFVVATSDVAYGKKSSLDKEIKQGLSYSHDGDDPLFLSQEELTKLYRDKIIYDAKR